MRCSKTCATRHARRARRDAHSSGTRNRGEHLLGRRVRCAGSGSVDPRAIRTDRHLPDMEPGTRRTPCTRDSYAVRSRATSSRSGRTWGRPRMGGICSHACQVGPGTSSARASRRSPWPRGQRCGRFRTSWRLRVADEAPASGRKPLKAHRAVLLESRAADVTARTKRAGRRPKTPSADRSTRRPCRPGRRAATGWCEPGASGDR